MAENDADPPPPGLQSAGIAVPLVEAAHAAQTGLLREKGWEVDGNFLRVSVPKLKAADRRDPTLPKRRSPPRHTHISHAPFLGAHQSALLPRT